MKLAEDFVQLLTIKRYSYGTIKTYKNALLKYLNYIAPKQPEDVSVQEIENYINHQVTVLKISQSYQKQLVGAIKLFYSEILRRKMRLDYLYPDRREHKLPNILSKQDVSALLNAAENIKHKAILMTIYSAGLRLGEVINLKVRDIDSQRMVLRISEAKGKKDREVMLSERLLLLLREYWTKYHPKEYLFEGQNGGKYSSRSVQ